MFGFFKRKSTKLLEENPHLAALLMSLKIKTSKPELYLQSLRHKSVYESTYQNNERLEFLGDSILDSVVAEVLFEKFPQAKEGFLTQMRSRIVSRSNLNRLGIALGLNKHIEVRMERDVSETSLSGNALEAIIGAVYMDKGFDQANEFIRYKILAPYVDFNAIVKLEHDPKSRIIEKAQKERKKVYFNTGLVEKGEPQSFKCTVVFNGDEVATAFGSSKKKAEQKAAAEALKGFSTPS